LPIALLANACFCKKKIPSQARNIEQIPYLSGNVGRGLAPDALISAFLTQRHNHLSRPKRTTSDKKKRRASLLASGAFHSRVFEKQKRGIAMIPRLFLL